MEGGRAGGEPHSSVEEEGVRRCYGFWVSRLGLVQGNGVNPHVATCDRSHVRAWQEATCDKETLGLGEVPVFQPSAGPLSKPLSWGALCPHLGPGDIQEGTGLAGCIVVLKKCLLIAKMQSNHCKMIFSEPPKPMMRLHPCISLAGGLGEGFSLSKSSFFTLKWRQQES